MSDGRQFYIRQWSNYQHPQTVKWVKVYRSILNEVDFVTATANQRLSLLASFIMADECGRLPNSQRWLDVQSGAEPFELDWLLSIGFLTSEEPEVIPSKRPDQSMSSANDLSGFDLFWREWPRKVAKRNAEKAWAKQDCAGSTEEILKAVKVAKAGWEGTEMQFIPHPATWLNGHRWEDSVDTSNASDSADAFGAGGF